MLIPRLLFFLLLSGLLALSPAASFADTAANAGSGATPQLSEAEMKAAEVQAEAEAEAKAVQEAWEALIDSHKAQLDAITLRSQKLRVDLKGLDTATQTSLALLEQEFQRLDALSRVNDSMPSDLTVLTERIKRVRERAEILAEPLRSAIEDLEQEKQSLALLESSLTGQKGTSASNLLLQVRQTKDRIIELQQYYALTLNPV